MADWFWPLVLCLVAVALGGIGVAIAAELLSARLDEEDSDGDWYD